MPCRVFSCSSVSLLATSHAAAVACLAEALPALLPLGCHVIIPGGFRSAQHAFVAGCGAPVPGPAGHDPRPAGRQVRALDELYVRMPTPEQVHRLDLSPGTPIGIHVATGFTAEGQPVRVAVTVLPGDRHVISYKRQREVADEEA